jgi:hypothetical protein
MSTKSKDPTLKPFAGDAEFFLVKQLETLYTRPKNEHISAVDAMSRLSN